jgi:hypothetical protein
METGKGGSSCGGADHPSPNGMFTTTASNATVSPDATFVEP